MEFNADKKDAAELRLCVSEAKPDMKLYQSMQVESNYLETIKDKPAQFQILDETSDRIFA